MTGQFQVPRLQKPRIKSQYFAFILSIFLSPLAIFVSAFNLLSEWIDRWFMRSKLTGEDERSSTREIMQGEGVALLGIIGGGLSGVILTNLASINTRIEPWARYGWFLLFILIAACVVLAFRWMRWQMTLAESGAWEPGVAPEIAIKTLCASQESAVVKTIWPGAVRRGLAARSGLCGLVVANRWRVLWRCGFWTLVPLCLYVKSELSWEALAFCCGLFIFGIGGVFVSLLREYFRTSFQVMLTKARYRYLRAKIVNSNTSTQDGSGLDELNELVLQNSEILRRIEINLDGARAKREDYTL